MMRSKVFILTAAVLWSGASVRAGDPAPSVAPTSPQVPAPYVRDGQLVTPPGVMTPSGVTGADQVHLPAGTLPVKSATPAGSGECEPFDPMCRRPKWCTDCAPAVRYPLPPLPGDGGVRRVGHFEALPACGPAGCATGHDGSCWAKFKGWLCFQQTPVKLPHVPTQRITPAYTYFPCVGRPGGCVSANCGAGGNCGAGNAAGMTGRGPGGCVGCPTAGEPVIPGYRLANTDNASRPASGVVNSSYKVTVSDPAGGK